MPTGLWDRGRRANLRDLGLGWVVISGIAAAVMVTNALTELSDNTDVATWEPWIWEGTSAAVMLALLWLPWLAAAAAPPSDVWTRGWVRCVRFGLLHLAGAALYTGLHIVSFVVLRTWAYDWADAGPYDFGDVGAEYVYEFRKDLLSYAAFVAVFWLVGRLRLKPKSRVSPVSFDIREGGRIIRAPLNDILAVCSAGNYVEFWLSDGRRPLMRATLAAIEVELGGLWYVRAHRSWLINSARVTGLAPDGSGDWTVELGELKAPVSRRYPDALQRLKAPASAA